MKAQKQATRWEKAARIPGANIARTTHGHIKHSPPSRDGVRIKQRMRRIQSKSRVEKGFYEKRMATVLYEAFKKFKRKAARIANVEDGKLRRCEKYRSIAHRCTAIAHFRSIALATKSLRGNGEPRTPLLLQLLNSQANSTQTKPTAIIQLAEDNWEGRRDG